MDKLLKLQQEYNQYAMFIPLSGRELSEDEKTRMTELRKAIEVEEVRQMRRVNTICPRCQQDFKRPGRTISYSEQVHMNSCSQCRKCGQWGYGFVIFHPSCPKP